MVAEGAVLREADKVADIVTGGKGAVAAKEQMNPDRVVRIAGSNRRIMNSAKVWRPLNRISRSTSIR